MPDGRYGISAETPSASRSSCSGRASPCSRRTSPTRNGEPSRTTTRTTDVPSADLRWRDIHLGGQEAFVAIDGLDGSCERGRVDPGGQRADRQRGLVQARRGDARVAGELDTARQHGPRVDHDRQRLDAAVGLATDGRGNRGVEIPAAGEMVPNERRRVALEEGVEQGARPALDDAGAHVVGQRHAANVEARLGSALDGVLEHHAVRGARQPPCANPRLVESARAIQLLQPVAVALPGRELEAIATCQPQPAAHVRSGKPGVPAIRTSVTRGPGGRGGRDRHVTHRSGGSCRNSYERL